MRKYIVFLFVAIVLAISVTDVVKIDASSATTYTFARDSKGRFVVTQNAYLPDRTVLDLGLDSPEDIFMDENDNLFIADTRNQRIVVFNPSINEVIYEITYDEFSTPRGIFITQDNILYVADSGAEAVFKFELDGTFIEKFTKPTSASFEGTIFSPKKIAVDNQSNMFIVAEGLNDGIIQLSDSGEFLGYFATNSVVLTPKQRIENTFFSESQLEQVSDRNPVSFSNVFVDSNGIKYSTSLGDDIDNLKKHNTDGSSNIDSNFRWDLELVDIYTDSNGIIYTASSTGFVSVFTSDGDFIFTFGSQTDDADVSGLYSELNSIAVDSTGKIWTIDGDKSFIQSYSATEYSETIYNALSLYQQGRYGEAVEQWEEVLKLNQLSVIAHNEIGRNLYSQADYEEAMEHFILAGNRDLYSQSYWEVRNISIQNSLPYVILALIVYFVIFYIVKYTNRQFHYLATPINKVKKVASKRGIADILFLFSFIKHPLDSFYYLKKKEKGSYKGATIIIGLFFISYFIFITSKGFIYQYIDVSDMDLNAIILGFFSILSLFIICNYLVASINDGEGTLGEMYKGVAYSLLPIMVSYLLATFLSHYFTYNEVFVLDLIVFSGMGWSGLLIFLSIQELHNYRIRESIKSLLMTFLFMLILAVLFAFIQIMGDQLIQFVTSLIKEAFRNVFS